MAAVAAVGVGMMMMCCSSSVAAVMMSGEEKKDDSGGGGGGGADDDSDSDDDTTLTATEQAKADAATAKAAADAVAADPDATLNEKRLATNTSALAAQAAADAVAADPDATPADTVAAETEAENAKAVAVEAVADAAVADAQASMKKFFCFSGYTKVNMASGETMCIKDISLGDELAGGTLVDATMQIKNRSNDPFYRFNSTELGDCVYVTGSHYIHHDDKYIFVEDHPEAVLTDKCDDILYCLVTSDHTIPVGEFKFWDWEDNLIRH
jgi:hypothetical protein